MSTVEKGLLSRAPLYSVQMLLLSWEPNLEKEVDLSFWTIWCATSKTPHCLNAQNVLNWDCSHVTAVRLLEQDVMVRADNIFGYMQKFYCIFDNFLCRYE